MAKLPASLRMAADIILKVRADGKAEVVKSKVGNTGAVIPAVDLLVELGGVVPEALRTSRWTLIGGDGDWL